MKRLIAIVTAIALGTGLAVTAVAPAQAVETDIQIQITDPTQVVMDAVNGNEDWYPKCATSPTGTKTPLSDQILTLGLSLMQGQNVTLYCSIEFESQSYGSALGGSATSATYGTGTLDPECDLNLGVVAAFKVDITAATQAVAMSDFNVSVDGDANCSFNLDFGAKGALAGTIAGKLSNSGANTQVTCPSGLSAEIIAKLPSPLNTVKMDEKCIGLDLAMDVTAVGGSGEFAGQGGSGSYTTVIAIPIFMPSQEGLRGLAASFGGGGAGSLPPGGLGGLFPLRSAVRSESGNGLLSIDLTQKPNTVVPALPKSGAKYVLGKAADGTGMTAVFTTSPGAKVVLTGKSAKAWKSLKSGTATSGAFDSKLTAAAIAKKLGTKLGKTVTLRVKSTVAGKAVTKTYKVTLQK